MKTLYIGFSLILSVFVLSSCGKDDTQITSDIDVQVTRAFISSIKYSKSSADWSTGDVIGISAYKSGTGEVYENYEHKRYQTSGNNLFSPLTEADKIIYPLNGDSVDFIAYYPYKPGITNDIYEIDLSFQTSLKAFDFLYSSNAIDKSRNSAGVNLEFNHQLSKIVIDAIPGEGLTEQSLNEMSILIEGTYSNAAFNLSDGSLLPRGEKASIVMNTDGYHSEAIILPGFAPDIRIAVVLSGTDVYTAILPDKIFQPGTAYYYRVKINRTEIEIYSTNIAEWQGTDVPPGTGPSIEATYDVGDYFPNPSDAATAIGVVYWLAPGSARRSGKILSLDTSEKVWSINNTQTINAISIVSGVVNMNAAIAANPTLQSFPAFQWCADKGEGWYLPGRYELHVMREQWENNGTAINSAIEIAGGEVLSINDVYLTSSESKNYSASMAESYSFSTKVWLSNDKTTLQRVRAIKAF